MKEKRNEKRDKGIFGKQQYGACRILGHPEGPGWPRLAQNWTGEPDGGVSLDQVL